VTADLMCLSLLQAIIVVTDLACFLIVISKFEINYKRLVITDMFLI
jgi:hypothetical protein